MTSLTQRLQIKQTQTLTITSGLCQAIALLEMSNLDLDAFLTGHIESNPLLTLDGDQIDTSADDLVVDSKDHDLESLNGDIYDNMWTNDSSAYSAPAPEWDNLYGSEGPVEDRTLRAHLISQIEMAHFDLEQKIMALYLVDSLDACGYLDKTVSEIGAILNTPEKAVENLLRQLQSFSPAGVFARNLAECLSLQIADKGLMTPSWQNLLTHLDLLYKGNVAGLAKKIALPLETTGEMVQILRALNPKPGLIFESESAITLIPDVYVFYDEMRDEFRVRLNESTLPKIALNPFYTQKNSGQDKETNRFIGAHWRDAQFLLNALKQRADSIMLVTTEIVRAQDGFFRYGAGHIKPMILKDIASNVGLHESTVSRITTGKYMATPRGNYELKYFFNSALSHTESGADHSSASVKHRLEEIIHREKPDAPLSDDALKSRLRIEGIDISRRTVTKYREALGLGTSYQRKRQKAPGPGRFKQAH